MLGRHELGQLLLPRAELPDERLVDRGARRFGGLGRDHRLPGAGHHAVECVIVARRDRVELVIVASGTGDGQAHQPPADDVDPVVDHVVEVAHEPTTQGEEPHRGQRRLARTRLRRQPVGRKLLQDEPVVGQVAIEGGKDVVAIGIGPVEVGILEEDVALGVGISGDIEPVSSPAFAVSRRCEQPIDQPGVGVGRIVGFEGRDLARGGRQPDQVEGGASDQGPPVGPRRGCEPPGFEPGQDEPVDRMVGPCGAANRRRRGILDRPERPVPRRSGCDRGRAVASLGRRRRCGLRPGGPDSDPGRQVVDGLLGQPGSWRHLDRRVVPDRRDEWALLRPARHHDGPVVVSLQHALTRVEPQARLLLPRPVTSAAMLGQDRAYPRLEELGMPDRIPSRRRASPGTISLIVRRGHRSRQDRSSREKQESPHIRCPSIGASLAALGGWVFFSFGTLR